MEASYAFPGAETVIEISWNLLLTMVPLLSSNPSLPLGTNCCTAHVQIQGKSTQNAFIKFWIQLKSLWSKPFHLQYELAGRLITILLIRN